MKVFVINLERSVARREFMGEQLQNQGLEFEFIQAVDGLKLSDEYLKDICDFEAMKLSRPWLLKKGVYGCALSHLAIYKRMVEDNIPFACVFEDDVILDAALKKCLVEIKDIIKYNEVILLFTQNNHTPITFSKINVTKLSGNQMVLYPMASYMLGSAAGYIITKDAAEKMLNEVIPIRYAADDWNAYYELGAVKNIRCVIPFVVKPAGLKSSIDYIESKSIVSNVMSLIDNYNVFPFKQILNWRRKKTIAKTSAYTLVPNMSVMDKS